MSHKLLPPREWLLADDVADVVAAGGTGKYGPTVEQIGESALRFIGAHGLEDELREWFWDEQVNAREQYDYRRRRR